MPQDAAEKIRTSFSRPGSAALQPAPAAAEDPATQAMAAALEAQMQSLQEAERVMLTSLMASPAGLHSPALVDAAGSPSGGGAEVLDVQKAALEKELEAKAELLQRVGQEREELRSSQSARRSSGFKTPPTAEVLKEEKRLKEVRGVAGGQ